MYANRKLETNKKVNKIFEKTTKTRKQDQKTNSKTKNKQCVNMKQVKVNKCKQVVCKTTKPRPSEVLLLGKTSVKLKHQMCKQM